PHGPHPLPPSPCAPSAPPIQPPHSQPPSSYPHHLHPSASHGGGAVWQGGAFCSLTSLQAEQFFELVATAQARRLDDQRADFAGDPGAEEGAEEGAKGPPEPPDQGEELYSTILTHQSPRPPLHNPSLQTPRDHRISGLEGTSGGI
uniref:G protein signaling modulator 3 n=1 Tax=Terrapene triunguis TaxID=2587831 RepID=A0A674IYJ5_9SAUR